MCLTSPFVSRVCIGRNRPDVVRVAVRRHSNTVHILNADARKRLVNKNWFQREYTLVDALGQGAVELLKLRRG